MSNDMSSGTLPEGWQFQELRTLVDVLDSRRQPVNSKERADRAGSVPYYGAAGQVGTIDKAIFNEPLILLGEDGVQFFDQDKHKAYEISGPAWVNNHAHVLRCHHDQFVQRLLVHYLNQFDYRNRANGTTRLKLTQAAMNDIPVLVPPLDEQEKIVEILEEQLSRLDAALEAVRAVRVKAAQFRRSLLHAAFTGALTGHDTSVGTLPDDWVQMKLNEALEVLIDHRGKTAEKLGGKFVDSGVRVVSAIHVKDGKLRFEERDRFVTDEIFQKWMPVKTKEGDVILTSEAPLGMVTVVPSDEPLVLSQRLFCLRGKRTLLSNPYLRHFLESPDGQEQLTRRSSGTTVSGIRQSELRQLAIPLPPPSEQEKIVEILEEQLSRLDASLAVANTVEKRAAALRRSLLHAAFTGNLTKQWRENAHV